MVKSYPIKIKQKCALVWIDVLCDVPSQKQKQTAANYDLVEDLRRMSILCLFPSNSLVLQAWSGVSCLNKDSYENFISFQEVSALTLDDGDHGLL